MKTSDGPAGSTSGGESGEAGGQGAVRSGTSDRIVAAAVDVLHESGYDRLSMREVSRRAGVTHVTTYGYFGSKQHVVAEAFVRKLERWGEQVAVGSTATDRLRSVFTTFGEVLADDPALSRASTAALLGEDPPVTEVRERAGTVILRRLSDALDEHDTDDRRDALVLAINGATLQCGLGYSRYSDIGDRLMSAAQFITAEIADPNVRRP